MGPLLFSPSSVFWRVNRELASGLAGPRAVLMQISHPLIAAGVADHSQFRNHRLSRLYRTSMAAAAITFGTRAFALSAVRRINGIHTRVHGNLREDVGRFAAGTRYDANDPELKSWVLATITDSSLKAYEMFVGPLSRDERAGYYQDSLTVAELFGIPERYIPSTYDDLGVYMTEMLSNGSIAIGTDARNITKALFRGFPLGSLFRLGSAFGIGRLPVSLRHDLDLTWNATEERWLERVARASRRARRFIPSALCSNPAATLLEAFAWQR
ncbi:MAG TPA: oxygenase MpaB family protein [Terriglobia bacterium]|nr:oxygenase MpaB family protein [Terriglobia bacterium]